MAGSAGPGSSVPVDAVAMSLFAGLTPTAHLVGPGDPVPVTFQGFFWRKALKQARTDTRTEKPTRLGPFELLAHISRFNLKGSGALGAGPCLDGHGIFGLGRNAGCEGSRR